MFFAGLIIGLLAGSLATRAIMRDSVLAEKVKAHRAAVDGDMFSWPHWEDEDVEEGDTGYAGMDRVGMVIMPPTEHELARERVLERNKKLGVDTPIEELT